MNDYNHPIPLKTNLIPYLIPGGPLIARFLGHLEDQPESLASQMWIASVVQCALEGARDSRSCLADEVEPVYLAELLEAEPENYLGKAFADRFGATTGFLLKLLNSRDRLLVQTHPDKERAQRYFGSHFGKTEAWYVLDTEGEAYVWAGFRPDVTRDGFLKLIMEQDIAGILECLHRFTVKRGDVIFIPAGLPHALGSGSLMAEIQEPTDITLRAERFRPDGSELPEESLHSGIGYEGLLDCFAFDCADRETVRRRIFMTPERRDASWGEELKLIGRETTDCFGMTRLRCRKRCDRSNETFVVTLVTEGSGVLVCDGPESCRLPIRKGSEIFLPHGVRSYCYQPEQVGEVLEILECYPPDVTGEQ